MDLDYRALCNAGLWSVGRLQTDADRERVVDSLANVSIPGGIWASWSGREQTPERKESGDG